MPDQQTGRVRTYMFFLETPGAPTKPMVSWWFGDRVQVGCGPGAGKNIIKRMLFQHCWSRVRAGCGPGAGRVRRKERLFVRFEN